MGVEVERVVEPSSSSLHHGGEGTIITHLYFEKIDVARYNKNRF